MAYHFKRGEAVSTAIRRIVREELGSASGRLRDAGPLTGDEAVHEARKSIKKVRAVLRLVFTELGPVAKSTNALLRNLARRLSVFRDSAVLVETLDGLKDRPRDDANLRVFGRVRARLVKDKQHATGTPTAAQLSVTIAFALERASERVDRWPLAAGGFPAIESGLERTFRRGRRALARVRKDPTPENFHEWRKRVKDHWYHVRLLAGIWADAMKEYEGRLKELETCLGDYHNLTVLRDRLLAGGPSFGNTQDLAPLFEAIDRLQRELRDRARALGDLYTRKPREFTRHASQLWEARQVQPRRHRTSPTAHCRRPRAPAA